MRIRKSRLLMNVRRFNQHRCNRYQSVAEHSFFVALMINDLMLFVRENNMAHYNPSVHAAALSYALQHDLSEAVTGDIPYLVRKKLGVAMHDIDEQAEYELCMQNFPVVLDPPRILIQQLIRFVDKYELKLYLEEELHSGNNEFIAIEAETYGELLKSELLQRTDPFGEWGRSMVEILLPCEPQPLIEGMSHDW